MTRTVLALARRALRNAFRRPQFLAPMLIFPAMLMAINVGGLHDTTKLSGFPAVHGFLDFQLAAAICQSLLLGGVQAGIATGLEIEGGFFERLVTAPIPRVAIVLGRLLGTAVIATGQAAFFLLLGLAFGAHIRGGVAGFVLVLAIGALAGTGFGALGMVLALRARNASIVQGVFPLVFVVLFISSAFFPRSLLVEPARSIAHYNPLSFIAEGMRDPIISSVTAQPVLEGLAAAAGVALVAILLCVQALRYRLSQG